MAGLLAPKPMEESGDGVGERAVVFLSCDSWGIVQGLAPREVAEGAIM